MESKPVKCGIGFVHSEIVSFSSADNYITIILKAWNEDILELEFTNCILFFIYNSWHMSELEEIMEVENSELFAKALDGMYVKPPQEPEFKLFHFIDREDAVAVEVGAKSLNIRRFPFKLIKPRDPNKKPLSLLKIWERIF